MLISMSDRYHPRASLRQNAPGYALTLKDFSAEVKSRGFQHVVLLGMGGSSLGPEVLAETFGPQSGWPKFYMLDATDPAQIRTIRRAIDVAKTLFIVASKSGSTLEPNIFLSHYLARVNAASGAEKAGESLVAVTNPGSPLESTAKREAFAHIFKGSIARMRCSQVPTAGATTGPHRHAGRELQTQRRRVLRLSRRRADPDRQWSPQ